MPEDNNEQDIKNEVKELEKDMKAAFKEERFDDVTALAEQIRKLDYENSFAEKIMTKMARAKEEARKKENAEKIKTIQGQIKDAFKESRFEEVKKLASDLKQIEPDSRFAGKFLEKTEKQQEKNMGTEATVKKEGETDKEKVKEYETMLKQLFREEKYNNLQELAKEYKTVIPESKSALEWMDKAQKAELKYKQKANAKKAKLLKKEIKAAFKESRFNDLKRLASDLKQIEPDSRFAGKFLEKTEKQMENGVASQSQPKTKGAEAGEEKPGFFSRLFAKKGGDAETADKASENAAAGQPDKPLSLAAKQPDSGADKNKGNVFTKVFGKQEDFQKSEKSIIDTIVAKSSTAPSDKNKKKEKQLKEKDAAQAEKKKEGLLFLNAARVFFHFSSAFILLSGAFFWVQNIDMDNTVLAMFGVEENYAQQLHNASVELEQKEQEKQEIDEKINLYAEGYHNEYEQVIEKIIDNRVNWPDIMDKISSIADYIYERNSIFQYIKFNSFSFDAKRGTVNVSGTLSDPLGKNLTKLVELEEAFRYYPGSKNDEDSKIKPYFYDVKEFNSFSKSYNSKTGRYSSGFQLSFSLEEPEPEAPEDGAGSGGNIN